MLKTTTCLSTVPAVLTSNNSDIAEGTVVEYKRIAFRNGEHVLVLENNDTIPAIFFDAA